MSTVNSEITRALMAVLDTHVWERPARVFHPGQRYERQSELHLVTSMFFTSRRQISLGTTGMNRHRGFLQVSVFEPLRHGALDRALLVAGEVETLYLRGTILSSGGVTVHVDQPPSVSSPVEDENWMQVPVTVNWRSDNANI